MNQKILVTGFPHCGTSILKSIISHVPGIREEYNEMIDTVIQEKVVFKWPFFAEDMVHRNDCHKIFIMRNPIWVMSSLNKRFNYKPQQDHTLNDYIQTLELFKKYKENPVEGLHLILYEDIFENNFEKLKEILDLMDLKYSDEIFDNSQYNNIINKDRYMHIPIEPDHIYQGEFRNWQINQKFENNNFPEKIDILGFQKQFIQNNNLINEFYPNIKASFLDIA